MINTLDEFYDFVKEYKIVQISKEIRLDLQIYINEVSFDKLIELAKKEDESVLFVLVDKSSIERQHKVTVTVYVIYKTFLLGTKLLLVDSLENE